MRLNNFEKLQIILPEGKLINDDVSILGSYPRTIIDHRMIG
jgi:hypothetical protein